MKKPDRSKTLSKTITVRTGGETERIVVTLSVERTVRPRRTDGIIVQVSSYAETRRLQDELGQRAQQHDLNSRAHRLTSEIMRVLSIEAGIPISKMTVKEG